ncbi:MAG: hypothetical protein A3J75_05925 [Acidobacteria bacterium RBG_16_68_9]|nr:MAG: hypothetical protein A3J75_05925 [Acidobacteria bacterium RBG_16_68_9]
MNTKVIIGVVVASVVLVAGYFALSIWSSTSKWAGPVKEIEFEKFTKDGDITTIQFTSRLDAPLEKVQAAMWGVERGAESVEGIRQSKLVKAEGNSKVVELQLKLLSLPLQQYTMEFTLDPGAHRMTFKTLQSQTQDLSGWYHLEGSPDGKQTSISYEARSRAKIPLPVPQSVQESAQKEFFVNTIRGIKKRVEAATG